MVMVYGRDGSKGPRRLHRHVGRSGSCIVGGCRSVRQQWKCEEMQGLLLVLHFDIIGFHLPGDRSTAYEM